MRRALLFLAVLSCLSSVALADERLVLRGRALPESTRYLEIGDRTPNESVEYPHDDLAFASAPDGTMVLVHKDGRPY